MKLLLISNSTNAGEEYLRYPLPEIGRFLDGVREIVFVPYAAVTFSYADYEKKVQARFAELGIRVRSVHRAKDPVRMIRAFWKYRWLSAYLATPMMVDKDPDTRVS